MQITQRRILEDIMPLRIIREVEKWPVIYKKDSPEMTNPHFKYKVWEEVAKNLIENFQIYTAAEKQSKVTDLMKKWRNLRDTFKRHLKLEKKDPEGHKIRRKGYVYFKQMSFLLPHMTEGEPQEEVGEGRPRSRRPHRTQLGRNRQHVPPLPSSSTYAIEHIDADKHFLLSLLPSFKRLSEDAKHTAKMKILKVIKDVKTTSAALETVMADNTATLAAAHSADEAIVVKNELFTVEVSDYKFPIPRDSGSGDTE